MKDDQWNLDDWDAEEEWQAELEFAKRRAGIPAFDELAKELRESPIPPKLIGTPLILDTDIGGDPDDAIALAVAARNVPELALVITCDEREGQRARFARHLLNLLDRPEVPVVAGKSLEGKRYFVVDGMTPAEIDEQPRDVLATVGRVAGMSEGPLRWCGIGPLSNLAQVLTERPDVAERLVVT